MAKHGKGDKSHEASKAAGSGTDAAGEFTNGGTAAPETPEHSDQDFGGALVDADIPPDLPILEDEEPYLQGIVFIRQSSPKQFLAAVRQAFEFINGHNGHVEEHRFFYDAPSLLAATVVFLAPASKLDAIHELIDSKITERAKDKDVVIRYKDPSVLPPHVQPMREAAQPGEGVLQVPSGAPVEDGSMAPTPVGVEAMHEAPVSDD